MSKMLLMSSSCVLVFLLCLSHECNGRHLSTNIDDHAIKGLENDQLTVHDDLNLEQDSKVKDRTNNFEDNKDHYNRTDCGSKNKKVKKFKELVHCHQHQHHPKSITFHVPPKNKRIHQQPGFNLDYSPPKTHPPSHN
ncbi:hypothetical protein L1987_28533 [Smallanthus sonchifolius]|uniref:Uncharacterized protein n=1 Tax=Smallanthus sonchifolius TaxID=185202 RepID=A0ACB9I048_9ASTR|nr:hypothetical protein L1987_28533 [Smallanthus sonchifolius]